MSSDGPYRFIAETERWTPMTIREVQGYFNDARIARHSVPENFHFWELADDTDNDGFNLRYKNNIMVNFFGTFITTGDLPIDSTKHHEGFVKDGDWKIAEYSITFADALYRDKVPLAGLAKSEQDLVKYGFNAWDFNWLPTSVRDVHGYIHMSVRISPKSLPKELHAYYLYKEFNDMDRMFYTTDSSAKPDLFYYGTFVTKGELPECGEKFDALPVYITHYGEILGFDDVLYREKIEDC